MDYEEYRKTYFVHPQPAPRFEFAGIRGASIFVEDYDAAVEFYSKVLGPPCYIETEDPTRGWQLGDTWLTLFQSKESGPKNTEINIQMRSAEEADRLQAAFKEAGAKGPAPGDVFMYDPIHYCPVQDPFGTSLLIFSVKK